MPKPNKPTINSTNAPKAYATSTVYARIIVTSAPNAVPICRTEAHAILIWLASSCQPEYTRHSMTFRNDERIASEWKFITLNNPMLLGVHIEVFWHGNGIELACVCVCVGMASTFIAYSLGHMELNQIADFS